MKFLKSVNLSLIVLPLLLITLSLVTLFSTAPEMASSQVIFVILGVFVYVFFAFIDYRIWFYLWKYFLGITTVLLLTVYFIGDKVLGSARWLEIGSFRFQPSEIAKLAIIISISAIFSKYKKGNLLNAFFLTASIAGLVFIQPDLGTSILIFAIFAFVYWFSGGNKIYFLIAALLFGIFSSPVWNLLKDYQKRRILIFLNPNLDVLGSGYNVIQAGIAVGSGGFLGRGFGHGTQSHLQFLPIYWTDFIFAAFAEEWGFVGAVGMIIIFVLLLFAIYRTSLKSTDMFGSLLAIGIFAVILCQFIINVGMNLGLLPVTGIPLPLVSHGGSSMLVTMAMLGLVQSVWLNRNN